MSAIAFSSASGLGSGVPVVNAASEPAEIRDGNARAKQAYQEGLGFEQVLVSQLTQAMSSTLSGSDANSDGLGGTTDDSSGLTGGSDPAASTYDQMLPGALTSGIMSQGGTGIALQLAQAIDPALMGKGARS